MTVLLVERGAPTLRIARAESIAFLQLRDCPTESGRFRPAGGHVGQLRSGIRELALGAHAAMPADTMTERTPKFDHDDLLFDDEMSSSATADLPGAFSSPLPRGSEIGRAMSDVPPGAEVRYRIPGVPVASDGDEVHFVPANRSYRIGVPLSDDESERFDVVCRLDTDPAAGGTIDLPPVFSPERTTISPQEILRLAIVFDHFDDELVRLAHRWGTNAPVVRITSMVRDLRSFMRILLDDVELEPVYTRSAETTLLVHDTYVRMISVAGILREAIDERWANLADLESAYAYAEATLDAFTPFVGLADRAMRRICLEGETLEAALRWLAHQLDEEAAERLHAAEAFVTRAKTSSRDN